MIFPIVLHQFTAQGAPVVSPAVGVAVATVIVLFAVLTFCRGFKQNDELAGVVNARESERRNGGGQ